MTTPAYCTILARNYLPKALTLADSLREHHPDATLTIMLIDALREEDLPVVPGAHLVSTAALGLPEREVLRLAAMYDLVEFATSVKPVLLARLLEDHESVVYLDPDTYVTSPMVELPVDLAASEGGILLTPHFLEAVPAGVHMSEGHLLTVGFHNLGFCAVDRRAEAFLDWWWGHLQEECLHDFLSGLFVDQKWVDIGGPLFRATSWRHYGYNVGIGNLHERPVVRDADGYVIATNGDRLRLFHFHAFDSSRPEELSVRFDGSTAHFREENAALDLLCKEYAAVLVGHEQALRDSLGEPPPYPYWNDTRGKRIARQTRRAYRLASADGTALPSPFVAEEADAYTSWRRAAWKQVAKDVVGDAAKSVRCAFPDEYARVKDRFPGLIHGVRSRFVSKNGIWG